MSKYHSLRPMFTAPRINGHPVSAFCIAWPHPFDTDVLLSPHFAEPVFGNISLMNHLL